MPWTWSRVVATVFIFTGIFIFFLTPHHGIGNLLNMLGCLVLTFDSWRLESLEWTNKPFERDVLSLFRTPVAAGPFERDTTTHLFD